VPDSMQLLKTFMNGQTDQPTGQPVHAGMRRGSAIILVSAMLVLLVLIATVFLSRMRAMRQSGQASRVAMERDNSVSGVAETIAAEVAGNLFARPIDYDLYVEFGAGRPPDQGRRKVPATDAVRYGRDPFFAWNHAPHATVPWTNPPDWLTWPIKPGPLRELVRDGIDWSDQAWMWPLEGHTGVGPSPVSLFPGYVNPGQLADGVDPSVAVLDPAENPLGDPGIGDSRFLRDLEPQRIGAATRDYGGSFDAGYNALADVNYAGGRMANMFSHWRHMTYIPAPWNGWRLARDIADVTGVRTAMGADGYPDGASPWADGRIYYGGLMDRLDIPVEQFPAVVPTECSTTVPPQFRLTGGYDTNDDGVLDGLADIDQGTAIFNAPDNVPAQMDVTVGGVWPTWLADQYWDHWDRMRLWMTPLGWRHAMQLARVGIGGTLPINYYRLSDLNGNGVTNEPGERPEDEFVKDTPRWHVGRTLADSDGDGMTDSFWNLVPHVGTDGTRQLVAVSVTDNSARLNLNTATRFFPFDRISTSSRYNSEASRGRTPVDLAMVGQNYAPFGNNDDTFDPRNKPTWNTGLFDFEGHQPIFQTGHQDNVAFPLLHGMWNPHWSPHMWNPWDTGSTNIDALIGWQAERWQDPGDWTRSLLGNLGLRGNLGYPDLPDQSNNTPDIDDINDRDNREYYWQTSAGHTHSPQSVTTPFGLSDELELRAYEGNNLPWLISRIERATGVAKEEYGPHALRAQVERAESVEGYDQLDNRQMAADLRHRITTVNGARNETMAPHLWWENRAPKPDARTLTLVGTDGGIVPASNAATAQLWKDMEAQMREKLDLRVWQPQVLRQSWLDWVSVDMLDQLGWYRRRNLDQRLTPALMLAMTGGDVTSRDPRDPVTGFRLNLFQLDDVDSDNSGVIEPDEIRWDPTGRQAYHGSDDRYSRSTDIAWEQTRRSATALAQSIAARRLPRLIPNDVGALHGGTTFDMGPYPLHVLDPAHIVDDDTVVNRHHPIAGAQPLYVFLPGYDPNTDAFLTGVNTETGQQYFGGLDEWNSWPQHMNESQLIGISAPAPNLVEDAIDLSDAGGYNMVTLMRSLGLNTMPSGPWQTYDRFMDPDLDGFGQDVERPAADLYAEGWDPHVFIQRAEPQPMIGEVFVAHVARPWMIPGVSGTGIGSYGFRNSNEWLMLAAYGDDDRDMLSASGTGPACEDLDDFMEPPPPVSVLAVQLLNPFDVPIRLFDFNPVTGLYDLPRFSLKLLRENRFDPESQAAYEIVLAPNSINNPNYNASQPRIEPLINGMADVTVDSRFSGADLTVPWFLPPASDDRPYALTILLNGVEVMEGGLEDYDSLQEGWDATHSVIDRDALAVITDDAGYNDNMRVVDGRVWASGDGVSDEAEAWIDFLDLLPSEQVSGDRITEPGSGLSRVVWHGDMVWRIVPDEDLMNTSGDRLLPMYASDWYDEDQDPASGQFNGPTIDPSLGVGVELIRKVYLDPDANLQPNDGNADGFLNHLDAVDVVIDRTVGTDGKDELAVVLTDQMARFRMPAFSDLTETSAANFVPQEGSDQVTFPWRGQQYVGNGISDTPDLRYPRVLSDWPNVVSTHSGDSALQDPDISALTSLHTGFRVDPYHARWSQWARYARPWSVDDYDVDVSSTGQQFPTVDQLNLAGRNLARPERRGPRFAIGDGRVTMSWSRDAAIGMETLPSGSGASGLVNQGSTLSQRSPVYTDGVIGAAAVLAEDPLLVDVNRPPIDPVETAELLVAGGFSAGTFTTLLSGSGDERDELVRALRSRRFAEQSVRHAPQSDVLGTMGVGSWLVVDGVAATDNVYFSSSEITKARQMAVGILDDPRFDMSMPYNGSLDSGALWDHLTPNTSWPGPSSTIAIGPYLATDFATGDPATDGWPLVYATFGVPPSGSPFADCNVGEPTKVGSTYHDMLSWNHGRIFDARWDPEGLGRYDFDLDGQMNAPLHTDSGHAFDASATPDSGLLHGNPYGYPWMSRSARLPWRMLTTSITNGVDKGEWHGYRCEKPHAFGFGATYSSRGRDEDGDWRTVYRDKGWGGTMAASYGLPWSFADKGLYGIREIDGDILQPTGFQLPSMKIRNFEQVGEVLNEMAVGTELFMPIAGTGNLASFVVWPGATPNPVVADGTGPVWIETPNWPPTPALPLAGYDAMGTRVVLARRSWPVTLRTLPEWIADEGHAGRLSLHGSDDRYNVVVGAKPVETEHITGSDPTSWTVPDWVMDSDDPRHLDPGQPAAGRVVDLFVCDGPGLYDLSDNASWIATGNADGAPDGFPDDEFWGRTTYQSVTNRDPSQRNAGMFQGDAVPGLVNINTAPVEVLRALPHMARLVHGSPDRQSGSYAGVLDSPPASNTSRPVSRHPRSALPEAIVQYRDGLGARGFMLWTDPSSAVGRTAVLANQARHLIPGYSAGPSYADRGRRFNSDNFDNAYADLGADVVADHAVRASDGTRGFASIGQLFNLRRPALYDFGFIDFNGDGIEDEDRREGLGTAVSQDAWRMDFAARNPFGWQGEQVDGPIAFGTYPANSPLRDPYRFQLDSDTQGYTRPVFIENPGAFLSTDTGRLWDAQEFRGYAYLLQRADRVYGGGMKGTDSLADGRHPYADPLSLFDENGSVQFPDSPYFGLGTPDSMAMPWNGDPNTAHAAEPRLTEVLLTGDRIAGDKEEGTMLFSGISNMITTRSDVFTVHMKIRTFKQDPETGVWDATDPANIIDDSRYVMVIDRSGVDRPGQHPKVLMLEKIED